MRILGVKIWRAENFSVTLSPKAIGIRHERN